MLAGHSKNTLKSFNIPGAEGVRQGQDPELGRGHWGDDFQTSHGDLGVLGLGT